jgi:hypothetical protein
MRCFARARAEWLHDARRIMKDGSISAERADPYRGIGRLERSAFPIESESSSLFCSIAISRREPGSRPKRRAGLRPACDKGRGVCGAAASAPRDLARAPERMSTAQGLARGALGARGR